MHTLILYLNDVPKAYGGGTSFWHLNRTIQPVKNCAVYFRNLHANHTGDAKTMHQGDPLETDEIDKWAVNSWIRLNDYYY